MLTADQRAEFEERGFVRVPGAFSRGEAAAMEGRVWAWLQRKYALSRSDPGTWRLGQATGMQSRKRQAVFDAIGAISAERMRRYR